MNPRKSTLMLLVFASSVSTAYGGDFAYDFINNMVGKPYLQQKDAYTHRSVTASVKKVAGDVVFLHTEEGTIRTLGVKEANRAGIHSLRPNEKVNLILDRGNSVLDITEAGGKGGFLGNEITGTVQHFDILNKRIGLQSEDGEIRSFDLRDAVATKLNGIGKGKTIILELDGQNRAMDAYRP